MMLGAIISPLYLCFGKVGWHCACQPFLDTAVTFRALIRLLEWLSLRRLLPTCEACEGLGAFPLPLIKTHIYQ